jgi:hypothetical protein
MKPKLSDFTFEQRYWAKNPGVKASGASLPVLPLQMLTRYQEFSGYRLKFRC